MKKFFQICVIAVLVFVLFQAVAGGSVVSSGQIYPGAGSSISAQTNTSAEGVQVTACLATIKGMFCVVPNVGWNS